MSRTQQHIYASNLRQDLGYPLRDPRPNDSNGRQLGQPYGDEGCQVGDVGYVDKYGRFFPIFNVKHPPWELQSLGPVKPAQFTQPPAIETLNCGQVLMSGLDRDIEDTRAEYVFTTTSTEGAVLILPNGATFSELQGLGELATLREHAKQYALRWVLFTKRDSLYLLTGVYRTNTWTLGSFYDGSLDKKIFIDFKKNDAGGIAWYDWTCPFDVDYDYYVPGVRFSSNQTVLIQGFEITFDRNSGLVIDGIQKPAAHGALDKIRGSGLPHSITADEAATAIRCMHEALQGPKNLTTETHKPEQSRSRQVTLLRVGDDASQEEPSILEDSHNVLVQKPQQPMDTMEVEDNVLAWDNAKRLMGMGAPNRKLAAEARLVDTRAKQSVKSQAGISINDIVSRSAFDLTGQVTKSGHHPFAKGSYGDIYKGTYRLGDRSISVAIKTSRMYLQHDQELPTKMKRFRREITVWQGLEHPNILPFLGTIVDSSTNPDIPAMVCPFAENGALTTYLCERDNELMIAKRLSLMNDVARGLQYLHSQQIVHGDLSGSNVLIDGEGKACIADFGLSTLLTRLGGSTFATTRQAKGTVRWMAPEVLSVDDSHGLETTPTMESDTYSFGSIMLQILTGKIPYHHLARDEQIVFAIARGTKHARPDTDAVTDHRWKFMEMCWSPAESPKSRPSSDEIAWFTGEELATSLRLT